MCVVLSKKLKMDCSNKKWITKTQKQLSSTHGPIFFESKAQPLIELAIFYNDRIAANNHVFTPFFH